jgi:hypothetical protein
MVIQPVEAAASAAKAPHPMVAPAITRRGKKRSATMPPGICIKQ